MPEAANDSSKKGIRDYLRRIAEERASLPEEQKVEIPNSAKYKPPIGVDANGKPLPVSPANDERS